MTDLVETQLAAVIASYYRREIGILMHQAEHWGAHGKPLAVHHRVRKADAYYQIVSLFEHSDAFSVMRERIARQDINPPGMYPPGFEINRYRDPVFVAALVKGEEAPADQVYVPGQWKCPKCKFTLHQFNLNAGDGSVTTRDEGGDKCPNCNTSLWRVTWKQDAMELAERLAEEVQMRRAAEEKLKLLEEQGRANA